MLTTKEIITGLFAVCVAFVWSAWPLVCEWLKRSSKAQQWAIVASSALLFCLAMWRGVAPTAWYYESLLF